MSRPRRLVSTPSHYQGEGWDGGHDTALRSIRGGNGRLTPAPASGWLRQ
ncbi:MAG: hypothetical protein Q7T21_05930 [Gallionella sp.]|nr:hypothetical protein [Gallionella sp.]